MHIPTLIKHFFLIIKSFLIRVAWVVISLSFMVVCVPLSLLPASIRRDNRRYFFLTTLWNHLLVFVTGIRIRKRGFENLPAYPDSPSIIVMNHTSALDIFLAELIAGSYPHIWIVKDEYRWVPLFNILLHQLHVTVRRNKPRQAARSLARYANLLKGGARHALMFPEGTRHTDGKIHDFLIGFAVLAKKLDRPVIPVLFTGLADIFPRGSLLIHSKAHEVNIIIGKPMHIGKDESVNDFRARVKQWYKRELVRARSD